VRRYGWRDQRVVAVLLDELRGEAQRIGGRFGVG
jgi:hypothetical protein